MQWLYRLTPFSVTYLMIFGLAVHMLYSKAFWMLPEGCGLFGFAVVGVAFVGFIILTLDSWLRKALSVKTVWLIETAVLLIFTFWYWV